MEMKLIFVLLMLMLILCSSIVYANVVINEIMYNPYGSDEGHEWIEIYSSKVVNLSEWKFYEAGSSHGLTLINGSWIIDGYAVIVDKWNTFLIDYPDYNGTLIDSSWSSLSQSGESLALKNSSGDIVDEVNYSSEWGGNEISLERIDPVGSSNEATNWADSLDGGGTPGEQNSLFGSCDWSISVVIDDNIWELEDNTAVVKWKVKVEENSDDGEIDFSYWIEDPDGEIVKSKINKSTNVSETFGYYQKTFHKSGGYIILAEITSTSCHDFNPENNFVDTPLIVMGEDQSGSAYKSSIKILDVPSSATFGEIIKAKINVYRGDTRKYAVYAWLEDGRNKASEKTTMHFKSKFTNYTLTIPIQIKPNCNKRYKDGKYDLIVEGLDEKDSERIKIEGLTSALCKAIKTECEECPEEEYVPAEFEEETELTYLESEDYTENIISKDEITGSMIYESKEIKAKRSGIFFFCLVLILVIAYFIFGKKEKKI